MASPASTPLTELATQLDDGRGMARTIADAKDDKQCGALHFAARNGNMELCKYLLEELKLDVNPKNVEGDTPLHLAAAKRHIETAKYLIDQGADPLIGNNCGVTALHFSAGTGKIELVDFILSKGVSIESRDSSGRSPLDFAAFGCREDAVKFLLEHQANPNAEVDGYPPLYQSISRGSVECLKLLIPWGAKVNLTFPDGKTPPHVAVYKGKLEVINCLLEAGADPNVRDKGGLTPVELATRHHDHAAKKMLYAAMKKLSRHGNRAVVEILSPKTSEIKNNPRSVDGIKVHEQAEYGDMQVNLYGLGDCSTPGNRQISQESEEAKHKAAEAQLRGYAAFLKEDYPAALKAFTQACRALAPDLVEACYQEGVALRSLQRFDEATNSFHEGVKLDPEDEHLLNAYGLGQKLGIRCAFD